MNLHAHPPLNAKIARLAAVAAFFTALAMPLRAIGVAAEQGALAVALMAALILFFLNPTVHQRMRTAVLSPHGYAIAATFIAWTITASNSFRPLGSLEISTRTALFTIASIIIWAVLTEHDAFHRLLWKTLVISAILFTLLALLSLGGVPKIVAIFKGNWLSHERPANVFKAYATSTMCLIPVVIWAGRRLGGNWRWWGYAFAPMALGVMLLTYNRSALAGLIAITIAGIALLAMAKRRHAKAMIATSIAAAGGIVAWVTMREAQDLSILEETTGMPLQVQTYLPHWLLDPHRQNIWKFAYERFLDHPWLGNGIDQLNRLPGAKVGVPGLQSSAALVPSHPHNWALEILAETGLVGFIPMVLVLIIFAWKLAKNYLQTDDEADLALFTLMAGFWASALFNFSIWAVWWQLTFLILFVIVSATRTKT